MNDNGLPYKDVFKRPQEPNNAPESGAEPDEPRRGVKAWQGFLAALVTPVVLIFIGGPAQYYLGMAGLALTELMILALALGFARGFRRNFREVFPLHLPEMRQWGGIFLVWCGFLGLSMMAALFIEYFFPGLTTEAGEGVSDFITTVPFIPSLLIVALMPAICEEALFRGFIQHSFGGLNRWLGITLTALMFGLFHLDPARLLPTGILGFGLAYVMSKTDNLLLPMLFHFINNSFSAAASFLLQNLPEGAEIAEAAPVTLDQLLPALIILPGALAFILCGARLLEKRRPRPAQQDGLGAQP